MKNPNSPHLDADMTLDRVHAILDAYGANPARWPEAERIRVEQFLRNNADAAAVLMAAQELDNALDVSDMAAPSAGLQDRLLTDFRNQHAAKITPFRPRRASWVQLGALAASLVLCVSAAWLVMGERSKVDLSDDQAWESLGDDLEFAAVPQNPSRQTP
jgi:hypothetical protein